MQTLGYQSATHIGKPVVSVYIYIYQVHSIRNGIPQ